MYINRLENIPFTSENDGDNNIDGLGRKLFKRLTVKNIKKSSNPLIVFKKTVVQPFRRSKTLRKVALVAGTAAALYFTGGAALSLMKKKGGSAPAKGIDESVGYQPATEGTDTTGYAGQTSDSVPGAPVASGRLFTPELFNSAAKVAVTTAKITPTFFRQAEAGSTADSPSDSPSEAPSESPPESAGSAESMFSGVNIPLVGGLTVGLVILLMMRKK